jgi:hypothetical protein
MGGGLALQQKSALTVNGSESMKTLLSLASQGPSLGHFEQIGFPLRKEQMGQFGVLAVRAWALISFFRGRQVRSMGTVWTTKCSVGDFSRFVEYTGRLNSYLLPRMIPTLAVISTGAEILLGLLLLVGWHTRTAALLSGILLMAFGLAMALALGAKAPLNLSVFLAAGGALLLAGCERFPFSVGGLLLRRSR